MKVNYVVDLNTTVLSETIRVEKDQKFLELDTLNVPEGWELGDNGGTMIYIADRDSVTVFVKEKPLEPEVNTKDVTVRIQYYDKATGAAISEASKQVKVTEGADAIILKAADLGNLKVDGVEYKVAADVADCTVAYREDVNEIRWVVALEKAIPDPQEQANATLHISYIANGKEISSQDITVTGKKGDSYIFTAENVTLQVPNQYEVNGMFPNTTVVFGETATVKLVLSRISSSSSSGSGSSGSGSSGSGSSGSRSSGSSSSRQLVNGRWVQDSVGWWYPFNDNTYAKGGWYYLKWNGKMDWYYFNDTGYLISGWFEDNGIKYYLHDVHDGTFGRMYLGWNKIGDQWYYFNDTTEGILGAYIPDVQVPAELLNQ